MRKIITLLLLCFIFIFGILISFYKILPPKIDTNLLNYSSSRYLLYAKTPQNYGEYPIYYPPVSTSPISSKYPYLLVYEQYQELTQQQTHLFFAAKRINELTTWGSMIPVQGNISSISQFHSLPTNGRNYTFESGLALYSKLLDSELHDIQSIQDDQIKQNRLNELKRYIFQNRNDLENVINNYSIDAKKKSYLFHLVALVFSYYDRKTGLSNKDNSQNYITYSLNEIIANHDYGIFAISMDGQDVSLFSRNAYVLINNKKLSLLTNQDNKTGDFRIVEPIDYTAISLLMYTSDIIYSHLSWDISLKKVTDTQSEYLYTANLSQAIPFSNVDISFKNIPLDTIMSIDNKSNGKITHLEGIEIKQNVKDTIRDITVSKKSSSDEITISLLSQQSLSIEQLDAIIFTRKLVDIPPIVLEKQSNFQAPEISMKGNSQEMILQAKNLTREGENNLLSQLSNKFFIVKKVINNNTYIFTFQPKTLNLYKKLFFVLVIALLITHILGSKVISENIKKCRRLIHPLSLISQYIYKITLSEKMYKIILSILFIIITLDTFLLKYLFDPLHGIIILSIFLLLTKKGSYKIFYISAIITFVYAFIAYFTHQQIWLMKSSSWTFELLLVGVVLDIVKNIFYE